MHIENRGKTVWIPAPGRSKIWSVNAGRAKHGRRDGCVDLKPRESLCRDEGFSHTGDTFEIRPLAERAALMGLGLLAFSHMVFFLMEGNVSSGGPSFLHRRQTADFLEKADEHEQRP
ncbi:unnamed protein product [Pleuronectes platessa]|uniref:Uncharacterized protein n=1 Tax=Pleuronectes platessa TaxID=8262 RepID=A0A9N7VB00_PLEPL|nr:unnamed protein product [Pleuronectes platessa]